MKCPKCNSENPADTKFCGECAAPLHPSEEISAPLTETLETPKEELTTGSTFAGRYQIIEELGKGGMGKVYKAQDTDLKEKVAIKLLKPEIAADKKTIERFRNELKFARKIRHKNVCQMYDLNKEEGSHYITMEYVDGKDLKGMIRMMGQLSSGKTIFIAKQVCDGLAEAHKLGVVHRDLKPQNVMVDEEGNSRIMDFGIARSLKAKGITAAGVMIGTPEYMSPEQVEGKDVDQRSDIYSLGVILYEMVTGRVPFEGDTPFTIGMKHKGEEPKDPKELNTQLPEDLNLVILRCLEKDKEKRYQSAGEVRAELTKIEKGIPTTEIEVPKRKPITSREITVTFGLKKLFIPALIVVALIIAAVLIWQLLPKREAAPIPSYKPSIAVISFENQTGDRAYDHLRKVIPNLLITNLEQSGYFNVATWERLYDLLKQIGKEDVEVIDRDLGFELCRMDGMDAIVLGSFAKAGDMFATDVKVLDVETKNLLKSASSKGEGEGSIIKTQIDELSKEISRGVGISEIKIKTSKMQIADVTTTSMEAYNLFIKGRENLEKIYLDEARQFLEKTIELDPSFAMAYLHLHRAYNRLGNAKARDEAIEKAKAFSHQATEKERLFIEAYYAFRVEGNSENAIRTLEQMLKKYPKEKEAHEALGYIYYWSKNLANESIEELNRAVALDPNYGSAFNQMAYIYMDMEDYEKALESCEKYASVSPGDANPFDTWGEIYLRMGRLDEAIEKYKKALEVKPDFAFANWCISYLYALKEDFSEAMKWNDQFIALSPSAGLRSDGLWWKGFYQFWMGSLEQSLKLFQWMADQATKAGEEQRKASIDWMMGWIYYERDEFELSRKCFKSWFDISVENDPASKPILSAFYNFYLGLVDLREEQINSARARLNEMESLLRELKLGPEDWAPIRYNLLHGEVLLAEKSLKEAVEVCKNILPLRMPYMNNRGPLQFYSSPFPRDVLARVYKQKGDLDKAVAEYERLITIDPASRDRYFINPKYHYRLARLYEKKGWKGKAIEHYEKFLHLWKDADPGISEVEDAKKRLTGLKSLP